MSSSFFLNNKHNLVLYFVAFTLAKNLKRELGPLYSYTASNGCGLF
jgi:hypothetical protein